MQLQLAKVKNHRVIGETPQILTQPHTNHTHHAHHRHCNQFINKSCQNRNHSQITLNGYRHCSNNHDVPKTSKNMIEIAIWMDDVPFEKAQFLYVMPAFTRSFADLLSFHNTCFADKKTILDWTHNKKPIWPQGWSVWLHWQVIVANGLDGQGHHTGKNKTGKCALKEGS